MSGVTLIVVPVPTNVPPGLPVYHFQLAPAPKLPPTVDSDTDIPGQILFLFFDALVAATDETLPLNKMPGEM